jgi:hypothetical protein
MIDRTTEARINQGLSFLRTWHERYRDLSGDGPEGKAGDTKHNRDSRDQYLNCIRVIECMRTALGRNENLPPLPELNSDESLNGEIIPTARYNPRFDPEVDEWGDQLEED